MVAEFRARMVGRVAILGVSLYGHENEDAALTDKDKLFLSVIGGLEAWEWVQARYPHLPLRKFTDREQPMLVVAALLDWHDRVDLVPHRSDRGHVLAVEFEDDQQATDFKLRWV